MNKFKWEEFEGIEGFIYAYYGKEELGFIEYWESWKKWVWNQNDDIIMSLYCLKEVIRKLEELENNGGKDD